MIKNPYANSGNMSSTPGSGRSPGAGNGNPLQYSCLGNLMDNGSWQATVHGAARVRHDLANKQQQEIFTMYDLWPFISFFPVFMLFIFLALLVRVHRQYILNQIGEGDLHVISLNIISIPFSLSSLGTPNTCLLDYLILTHKLVPVPVQLLNHI